MLPSYFTKKDKLTVLLRVAGIVSTYFYDVKYLHFAISILFDIFHQEMIILKERLYFLFLIPVIMCLNNFSFVENYYFMIFDKFFLLTILTILLKINYFSASLSLFYIYSHKYNHIFDYRYMIIVDFIAFFTASFINPFFDFSYYSRIFDRIFFEKREFSFYDQLILELYGPYFETFFVNNFSFYNIFSNSTFTDNTFILKRWCEILDNKVLFSIFDKKVRRDENCRNDLLYNILSAVFKTEFKIDKNYKKKIIRYISKIKYSSRIVDFRLALNRQDTLDYVLNHAPKICSIRLYDFLFDNSLSKFFKLNLGAFKSLLKLRPCHKIEINECVYEYFYCKHEVEKMQVVLRKATFPNEETRIAFLIYCFHLGSIYKKILLKKCNLKSKNDIFNGEIIFWP